MQASQNTAQSPARAGSEREPEIQPDELAEFGHTREARQLALLEGDYELLLELSANKFTGPAWERAATEFVRYGHTVIRSWLRTELIWAKCHEKRLAVGRRRDLRPIDIDELTHDTIATAIVSFRQALISGRWDHTKGASLSTYFIGNCLMKFTNEYRTWVRRNSRFPLAPGYDQPDPVDLHTPEHQTITSATCADLLAIIPDETTRAIVQLRIEGHAYSEIAELLGCTIKSVESRLQRLKGRRPQLTAQGRPA